jgi:hypothetical protein
MSFRDGSNFKIALGTSKIVGMGKVTVNGITADRYDSSEFGNNWKTFEFGMKDGGVLSFDGIWDPDDETGQQTLQLANLNNSDVYNLRVYIDNTSYYTPNATTGYFSPFVTTGADTIKGWVNVESWSFSGDKADLGRVQFSCKISGPMVLV